MRKLALIAALALSACSNETEPAFPDVSALYQINGPDLSCAGVAYQAWAPVTPPYTTASCSWRDVTLDGVRHEYVIAMFQRASGADAWGLASIGPASTR